MEPAISFLTQSKFYSPAFNAAIFDGPIRIYFAQDQENLALKIYFHLQKQMKELYSEARNSLTEKGKNIFVMLYPTSESFYMSFDKSHSSASEENLIVEEKLGEDMVLGVRGPVKEEGCEPIYKSVEKAFSQSMPSFLLANEGA